MKGGGEWVGGTLSVGGGGRWTGRKITGRKKISKCKDDKKPDKRRRSR